MKTKIYLTALTIIMSAQIAVGQQIIYGDQNEKAVEVKHCLEACDEQPANDKTVFYKVDEVIPNAFTTGNNTLVVCRLKPGGSDTNVICTTTSPEKGWGTMVSQENDAAYSYEEKQQRDGADIFSIAFTDPKNGWAVGELVNHSVTSGVVFHTEDGGKSWHLQFVSGTPMKLKTIGFTDPKNGWANGERRVDGVSFEVVMTTEDGGKTWAEQSLAQK